MGKQDVQIGNRPQPISTSYNTLYSMRHIALHLLTISLAIVMTGTGQDADYWLAQTASDYRNGTYSLALQDIEEYLDLNSSDLWAWNFKANLLIKLKRYHEAVDSFDQIIQLDPSSSQAYNDRALILSGALRQDQEALDSLDEALEINPNDANIWYNKGIILEKQKRYNDSLDAFGKATTLDPSLDKAWYRQGLVLGMMGRYNDSLQYLNLAIEQNPKNADAWNTKGLFLMELNSSEDALICLEKATSLDPSNRDFLNNRNEALMAVGRQPEKKVVLDFS